MKVALNGGAYTAHSVIASAQRCVNLFPETGPRTATSAGTHASDTGEPSTVAHYPTPGTRLLGTIGTGPIRGIFQCATGHVYVVSGDTLYSVDVSNWTGTPLGTLTPGIKTPVSMKDNGLDLVVVDGMIAGWTVNLASGAFTAIDTSDGTFSGADRVDYLDTFFIFNKPATPQFYISGSLAVTFDPLDFANKEAYSDLLVVAVVAHRLIYLFGERTTEIWYDAGLAGFSTTDPAVASTFQFAPMQSLVFIDHGCAAKYSPAVYDNRVFWLTRDRQGQGIVMMALGETNTRVSTFAIEAEFAEYDRISDAIGFCYQMAGHTWYVLTFPQADKTWCYDVVAGHWHQWAWIDTNGAEHRHRANCYWAVNDLGVVGDWQNGNLYALDNRVFTDNGQPIKRVRAFPHILNDGKRVFYRQFLADLETGWAPEIPIAPPAVVSGFRALPLGGHQRGTPFALSADGHTAVGSVGDSSSRLACYWTDTAGPIPIGSDFSEAFGVSSDGSVIVGNASTPFLWTSAAGLVSFGTSADMVLGISADGTRIVGKTISGGNDAACYWNRSFTRTNIGFLAGQTYSRALAVSADGSVIVGFSQLGSDPTTQLPYRWTSSGMVALPLTGVATQGQAMGVSADGSVIAITLGTVGACRWTAAGGTVALPHAGGTAGPITAALLASGDGATIAGHSDYTDTGIVAHGDYLGYWTSAGIAVPTPVALDPATPGTIQEVYPTGISADGTTIVGYTFSTNPLPWIYHIAAPVAVTATTSVNMISLRYSDDRGHSWGNPITQDIGEAGEYRTSVQFQRLGMARDRCFELSWSVPMKTALQGAFVDVTPASS